MRGNALLLLVGALLFAVPFLHLPAFYESFLYLVFVWAVLATSWNVLSGYSGYFSFGHGAYFGIGMYTTAVLAGTYEMPFLATLPIAGLLAAALGVGVGAVVFRLRRLRGELFALLTLAVTFVLATIVLNTPIDGGPGISLAGVDVPPLFASPSSSFYVMALVIAIATLLIARIIFHSRLGLGLFAIHDDEDAAEVLGVPTFRYKLIASAISCGLAGLIGGVQALFVSYVTVGETFSIIVPLNVVLMSVLGGTRHWLGPAVGAAVITALVFGFTAGNSPVLGRAVVGLILVVVILFLPDGLLGGFRRARPAQPKPQPKGAASSVPAAPVAAPVTSLQGRGEALLTLDGVQKSFLGLRALDGVSFDVRRGEILGLIGPNGSGKSTTINVITGHFQASGGRIRFENRDIAGLEAHRIAGAGIARTYQIPRPFAHLTILQNVSLSARFGAAGLEGAAADQEAARWLDFTGLGDKGGVLPEDLNLHQRKFLELARALAARPKLLLLDEVLSGLTPTEIDGAIAKIRAMRDLGTTIVFVEHVMRAVMELTDRVVVLNHGRVIAAGLPADVMRQPDVVTAYLGKPHA